MCCSSHQPAAMQTMLYNRRYSPATADGHAFSIHGTKQGGWQIGVVGWPQELATFVASSILLTDVVLSHSWMVSYLKLGPHMGQKGTAEALKTLRPTQPWVILLVPPCHHPLPSHLNGTCSFRAVCSIWKAGCVVNQPNILYCRDGDLWPTEASCWQLFNV